MRNIHFAALAAAGVLVVGGVMASKANAQASAAKAGEKAPAFSEAGTDGKTHTLASLSKKGPVFLYFIKEGCPVNHRAAPHYSKIYDTYGGKATFVGVYNGDVASAKKWRDNYKVKFTVLADEDMSVIRSYGAKYSPWSIMVENGKVAKIMPGGSPKELADVNTLMAKATKQKVADLKYDGAPSGGG